MGTTVQTAGNTGIMTSTHQELATRYAELVRQMAELLISQHGDDAGSVYTLALLSDDVQLSVDDLLDR